MSIKPVIIMGTK